MLARRRQPAQRRRGVGDAASATRWSTRRSSAIRRSRPSSARFRARCRRSSAGRRRSTSCRRAHGFFSASSFSGSCRTSWRLPGFIARTTRAPGFPMLPVIEPDGRSTARQAVIYALALLPVSLAPTLLGMAGPIYFAGALVLTLLFLGAGASSSRMTRSIPRRAAAVLRIDHLSAAAVDADDRGRA